MKLLAILGIDDTCRFPARSGLSTAERTDELISATTTSERLPSRTADPSFVFGDRPEPVERIRPQVQLVYHFEIGRACLAQLALAVGSQSCPKLQNYTGGVSKEDTIIA